MLWPLAVTLVSYALAKTCGDPYADGTDILEVNLVTTVENERAIGITSWCTVHDVDLVMKDWKTFRVTVTQTIAVQLARAVP